MMFKTRQYPRWIIVGWTVAVLFFVLIESIVADGWEIISQLPTPRWGFSTTVVDDEIYLIGGTLFENRNGPFGLSIVEVYNPQTNSWRRVADIPTPRSISGAVGVNGKIYVAGGYSAIDRRIANTKILKVVEVYDPQTDMWIRKQDMSIPRRQFGIGVVAGEIYVIGGSLNFFEEPWRLDHMEVYSPARDTWAKRAKMPTRRSGVEAAVVRDTIYGIGGSGWPPVDRGGLVLATVEAYHPQTNRWRKKPDMANLKTGFSTVVVDDEIYLIGGHAGVVFEEYLTTVEIYNPRTEKWKVGVPMPTGNVPFDAAVVNGKIYILGSERENGELSLDIEVFDTGFRAVTAIGKLSTRWGELKAQHLTQP